MTFWQQQQIQLAERFLKWQYEKKELPTPPPGELRRQSQNLVEEAQRIAQRTGRNVFIIIKELIRDLKKA
jgi:hypothetical protein